MYARITPYRLKPGTNDAATAILERVKPQILAMPGMRHFINALDDDGNGYVVSLVDSKEVSDANQARVQAIWAEFAELLAEAPTPGGYDVIANETVG